MTTIKNITYTIMLLILSACGGSGSGSGPAPVDDVALVQTISFASSSYEIVIGNTETLQVTGGSGTGALSFESSDTNVASVSASGEVTAIALGSATITATKAGDTAYSEATATTAVTVIPKLEQTITFEQESYSLAIGDTQTIAASGGDGTGEISYSSADESVATVTADGLLTALESGSTTITAIKAADELYTEATATAAVTVEVPQPDAPDVSLVWIGNSRLTISWADVEDAASYNLYYATESVAALSSLSNLASLDNSAKVEGVTSAHTITGLSNNVDYYVVVTAISGGTESDSSNEVTAAPKNPLNDTGITVSGNGTSGINASCTKAIQNVGHVPQDCDQGRDADTTIANNKVGTGVASFDYTKLGSDGLALGIQNVAWSTDGTEAEGSKWSCIRDNVTGLVWEIKTASGIHSFDEKVTWQNRGGLADATNVEGLCGITLWRVPSLTELLTIANNGRQNPGNDVPRFPNSKSQSYWTDDAISGVATNAWAVNFFSGIGNSKGKTQTYQVRLVAGEYAATRFDGARFVDNADGTLTDLVTGLMWKRCPEGLTGDGCAEGAVSNKVWGVAMKTARDSTFAGYDDWRLPNLREIQTLVDVSKNNPAQDTTVFPNPTNVLDYWTSSLTKKPDPLTQSWKINFQRGLPAVGVRTGSQNAQWLVRDAE